jgi:pSer/pThr/pTyr-binding forkhead associated (FHA) protein
LLTVPSPSHDISRTHLEVVPDGWRILVRDLHSTNGTVLLAPDGVTRRPLPPGESVPVPLGSVLELADGIAVLLDLAQ